MREPSEKRGCHSKANLGRSYETQAQKLSDKHNKQYGVYSCPHCSGTHLTTKLHNSHEYKELLFITD